MPGQPPTLPPIHVYVGSSYLEKDTFNTANAGGWGAIIVESAAEHPLRHFLSGDTKGSAAASGDDAQLHGALAALQFLQARDPENCSKHPIILHATSSRLEELSTLPPGWLPSNPGVSEHYSQTCFHDIAALKATMNVKIEPVTRKTPMCGDRAKNLHNARALANRAAWQARLKEQGYIQSKPDTPLRGAEAEAYLDAKFENVRASKNRPTAPRALIADPWQEKGLPLSR